MMWLQLSHDLHFSLFLRLVYKSDFLTFEEFINDKFRKFPFPPTSCPAVAILEALGGDLQIFEPVTENG